MALRPASAQLLRTALRPTYRSSIRCFAPRPAAQQIPTARAFSGASRLLEKKYSEEHEWVELDVDGKTGTLGVSTYAAKSLGDVVYVELPQVDQEVAAGDTIGAVESVKSASDILSPVAGTIVEVNSALEDAPGTINKSPEGEGWIAKIMLEKPEEMHGLMDKEAYDKHTGDAAEE